MKLVRVLAIVCLVAGCAGQTLTPDDVRGPLPFGETANVMQAGDVYISGQPRPTQRSSRRASAIRWMRPWLSAAAPALPATRWSCAFATTSPGNSGAGSLCRPAWLPAAYGIIGNFC